MHLLKTFYYSFEYSAVQSMLANNELCDPLLEFMPNSRSTILHQICADKNYQVSLKKVNKKFLVIDFVLVIDGQTTP